MIRPTSSHGYIWQQWTNSFMNELMDIQDGKARTVGTGSGTPVSAFLGNALVPNAWNHIAWVYDGTDVRLYQNGVLVLTEAKASGFAPVVTADAAAIGKNGGVPFSNPDVSFLGDLAWFKISDSVRYTGGTFTTPMSPGTADASTLMLIDPSSFESAPTIFAAPGTQGIVARLGVGNGNSTSPLWVAP